MHSYDWEFPDLDGEKAIRWGKWKGLLKNIKKGNTKMLLFDLDNDIKEEHDVAAKYPDVVKKMEIMMKQSTVPAENKKFRM